MIEEIGKLLEGELTDFKFVKSKRQLKKVIDDGSISIFIGLIPTSLAGVKKLIAQAHLRIDVLEDIYAIYNPYIDAKSVKTHSTLVKNCDEIIKDESLINGFNIEPDAMNSFVQSYAGALKDDVIPWLEKYSDEDNLLSGLISEDLAERITSDRLKIFPVGLSIYARRGEWEEFDWLAKKFLDYCEKPHAQVYLPLAKNTIAGIDRDFRG